MKSCPLEKQTLVSLYFKNKMSMAEIATKLGVPYRKVTYWMKKYNLKRRSWSEATYVKRNPNGDPFSLKRPRNDKQNFLKGLGLGLYWGEGTKADKFSVRISNSDPRLINFFLEFLKELYQIDERKLRFAIHLFSDINPEKAMRYWTKKLNVSPKQFFKTQIINLNRKGTYKKKSKYGVLTLAFQNKKLRNIIGKELKGIDCSCS